MDKSVGYVVRMMGLEPIRLATGDFKSPMSAIPSHPHIVRLGFCVYAYSILYELNARAYTVQGGLTSLSNLTYLV